MNRPRHVVFLSWRDTSHPDGGGSELYVETIAAGLARRGHRVTVLCARHPGSSRSELRDGVRFVRLGSRLSVYPRGLAWVLAHRRQIDAVVDVINGLPFATPLVRRHGVVGLIHHVHREQWRIIYPGIGGRLGWWVESRLVPFLYRRVPLITVSEASRADLVGLGFDAEQLTVVHNGTSPAPPARLTRASSPRLVVLSRLVPHKRIELAVDLVVDLRNEFPDLHLDLVGDGWWADEIDEHITRRNAGDRVTRHGHVDEQTRTDLLAQAWALVLPSVKEGWCLAVTEAAVVGTPALAFASAGGTRESIADGDTGLLADDYDDLVRKTRELLHAGPPQVMGTRARQRALTFDWESSVTAFETALGLRHSP